MLRTAQSLLNTKAPDLAHLTTDNSEDLLFLEQLAKEFPRAHDNGTQRRDSSCSSLQLITADRDLRISTAFNRKLSLQRTASVESKRSLEASAARPEDLKLKIEKWNSPPLSTVSSIEDESGFSSMNSFQELGIPTVRAKDENGAGGSPKAKDLKLWQKPEPVSGVSHKRWSSTPVEGISEKQPLKVLWV